MEKMYKIALVVIYNHRFDRNIPLIEKMYEGVFSHVYHVVPFYDGKQENVIPVYENSWFFSGYISQAYTHLKGKGFTHYFFVADDMLLHPEINEQNLFEKTGLKEDECFLDFLYILQNMTFRWHQLRAMRFRLKQGGVEFAHLLPNKEYAQSQLSKYGVPNKPIPFRPFLNKHLEDILKYLKNYKRRYLEYPLVGGYADIILVTAEAMEKFALYCGIFAATSLFVEIAVPTALALATDKLKLSKDIRYKTSGALWNEHDKAFLKKYNYNLKELIDDFPNDRLFLHPIKLSQWK